MLWDVIVAYILTAGNSALDLAAKVKKTFTDVLNGFFTVFARWQYALGMTANSAGDVGLAAIRLGSAIVGTLAWISVVKLPGWVASAIYTAEQYLLRIVSNVEAGLRVAVNDARNYALRLVNAVRAAIVSAVNALLGPIKADLATALRAAKQVFALLFDPMALVTWIAGSLWRFVTRWVMGNIDWIGNQIKSRILGWALAGASIIEQVIVKIL